MPKVDLTVTISVIIAICAIISPIITTLLNNHHLYKMRKLDDAAQLRKDSYFYKRGVYEDYLLFTIIYINYFIISEASLLIATGLIGFDKSIPSLSLKNLSSSDFLILV